jgi:hypothetical protein
VAAGQEQVAGRNDDMHIAAEFVRFVVCNERLKGALDEVLPVVWASRYAEAEIDDDGQRRIRADFPGDQPGAFEYVLKPREQEQVQ